MPIIRIRGRSSRVPTTGGKSVKGAKSFKGGKRPIKGPKKLPPPPRRDSISSNASSSSLSSPANLSNDDGYSGVDDVSDSDDEDADHVLAAEQEHIANERSSPRPTPDFDFDMDDDDEADDADDDDSDDELSSPPQEPQKPTNDTSSDEVDSWNGFNDEQDQSAVAQDIVENDDTNPPAERRVHFDLPHSDTDSDDEGDDGFFPDIFVSEENLDPRFRQERDMEEDNYSSDSQTYWDHHGDDEFEGFSEDDPPGQLSEFEQGNLGSNHDFLPLGLGLGNDDADPFYDLPGIASEVPEIPVEGADDNNEADDSYDSDASGDTTDDEVPVLIPMDSSLRRSMSGASSDAEPATDFPVAARPTVPRKRVCILNPITQKLVILTPPQTKRPTPASGMPDYPFSHDLLSLESMSFVPGEFVHVGMSPNHANPFRGLDSPWLDQSYLPPMTSLMHMENDIAFTASLLPNMMGSEGSSTRTDEDEEEEDEGEKDLDKDLFLNFDSDESDDEQGYVGADDTEATSNGKTSSPEKESGGDKATSAFGTLPHLGAMNVGAFRKNQTTQQLIARGEATQDSLSFSNPLFHGTLRGIRDGALPSAATSLTPERKRKPQPTKGPLENSPQKRRLASRMENPQKKHRSISDVGRQRI